MRLALLSSEFAPFNGGIGAYARELAIAATQIGHEVTVLAPDYHADQTTLDADFPFRIVRFADGQPSFRGIGRRVAAARRLLRAGRFDVVHAIDWPFFIPARLLRGLQPQARTLLTVHGSEIVYMQHRKRKLPLSLIGFWRQGWATWIANSRYTADLLLESFPEIPAASTRAIPLGLSPAWLADRVDRVEARAKLGCKPDDVIIVSLGRVVPRKGHAVVADALARLPEAVARRAHWWVIGPMLDADHAATLRAKTEGLAVATSFLGGLPNTEVRLRLSAADIFCLPGYRDTGGLVEGFGLVFLEAAAYGLPSIATRSGGIPEAVDDGVTGLLVPERDVAAVAGALQTLIGDEQQRARMSVAAIAKAREATWVKVAEQTYAG